MRSLEVCAGIGGLTLGLEMAGFTCAGLVEIDARCRAHLRQKWPNVPIFADMRALTDDDLRAVGSVDLLAGGIPCQPHSVAGKRLGHEDERDLWPDFLALGLRLGAKALLVENVRGLASSPGGLDRIARDLEASGYCWWTTSLRAADVGAPHLRDRLFVCAIRAGDAAAGHGDDGHAADRDRDGLQREAAQRGGEVGDAEVGRWSLQRSNHDRSEGGKPEGPHRGSGTWPEALGYAADGGRWSAAGAEAEGRREGPGQPGHNQGRQLASGPEGRSPWSDARPILCRDGKWRLIPDELAVQRMADGPAERLASRFPVGPAEPGRVARLRALGNAVVPLQAYVPARALFETMKVSP